MSGYKSFYNRVVKRGIDVALSVVGLPIFGVIYIVVAPRIKAEDHGPVFYKGERLGRNGKPFRMLKFRSMLINAPDIRNADGSTYNSEDDYRVTKIGKVLRKTSIDETPQLLNVFMGDMSWIGPRPDPLDDIDRYTKKQRIKLTVRPGITGYSQAYYRNEIEQDDKLNNDAFYATKVSFLLDLRIFFKTVGTVLGKKNIYNDVSK
ncbi:MAG TPA: sugar transferase [Fervidobacterium sp.]|nr:sugar transferase [Fervidobacterium sp.]